MKKTDESMGWAIDTLSQMFHLRNAPQADKQIEAVAKVFLDIVDDCTPPAFEVDPKDQPPPVYHHPKHYSCQETVDWLMLALWAENDGTFPSVKVISDTYERGKALKWGDAEEMRREERVKS